MAVLPDNERVACHAEVMRRSDLGITGALKTEWRQLLDDIDQFLSDNAATMNNAIRVGIRAKFTTTQKAIALIIVVTRRWIAGV